MKREALDAAWSRDGFAGAVPYADFKQAPAAETLSPTLLMRARAAWRAAMKVLLPGRTPEPLASLPPHLRADIGVGDQPYLADRAHFESQIERFARTSAQLGGASERFGPW